jgi:hypothetical protein
MIYITFTLYIHHKMYMAYEVDYWQNSYASVCFSYFGAELISNL